MGWPGLARKYQIQRPKVAAVAGSIRARPTAAGMEILPAWSSDHPHPP